MAVPVGKIAATVGKKVVKTVATSEGREKLYAVIFIILFLIFFIGTIPVAIATSAVSEIADFFGLTEEETGELQSIQDELQGYFPEEFEEEENIEIKGQYPVPLSGKVRITSKYGYRMDPKTGERAFHSGMDIVSNIAGGGNIIAIADGVVVKALTSAQSSGYGNMVMVYHEEEDFYTLYAHMQELRVLVGAKVKAYQILGVEGSTGRVTGRHLHFEMRRKITKDTVFNPYPYIFKNEE